MNMIIDIFYHAKEITLHQNNMLMAQEHQLLKYNLYSKVYFIFHVQILGSYEFKKKMFTRSFK